MHKALIVCRAGVGSSLMLKIKVNEVIRENDFPIEVEHASLDAVSGFTGDLIITLTDVANELREKIYSKPLLGSTTSLIRKKSKKKSQPH